MAPQHDFGTIDPQRKTGAALASDLNLWRDAVHQMHRGARRPSYARPGTFWVKEVSVTTWEVYFYTGTRDLLFAWFNPTLDHWTPGPIRSGSIPAAKMAQGAGSGLNADKLDGIEADQLRRERESIELPQGKFLRAVYSVQLDEGDGLIAARRYAEGLNIVGSATEGDGVRYLRTWGDLISYGSLTVSSTAGVASSGPIMTNVRVEMNGDYPRLMWMNSSGYSWVARTEPDQSFGYWPNAGADGWGLERVFALQPDGSVWTKAYGWFHERFAQRETVLELGPSRVYGNCGNMENYSGYEIYDAGDGRHRVRIWIQNCTNCVWENCNCQCAVDGGQS